MIMKTFDNIILIGRPATGKSEFIDFMKKLSEPERAEKFHIGKFDELDDFPWLWDKFLEDNLWEESGFERLYSHREGNNLGLNPEASKLFDLMTIKFNKEMERRYFSRPEFYSDGTLFIEFSRGGQNGFDRAFSLLSREIFKRAAILYIDVSFEESWRRNIARYEEKKKHSILAHMVTKRTMEGCYKTNDWMELTSGRSEGSLKIHDIDVPFVTMNNEPELPPGLQIAKRYGDALEKLWALYIEGKR